MANILVADVDPGIERLSRAVGSRHKLVVAKTVEDVESLLQTEHIDLVVCGVHFDESRMFECLALIKENPDWEKIPVLCFRCLNTDISNLTIEPLNAACKALGAEEFLDWTQKELVCDDPDFELLCEVERHLPKEVQQETACERRNAQLHGVCDLPPEKVNRKIKPKRGSYLA